MLNLLPKDQKKSIIREYRMRFWAVAFMVAFAGEIVALILLLPPYLTAGTRLEILNAQSTSWKAQNATVEATKLSDIVRQTNKYLNVLTSTTTPSGVTDVITRIVDLRGGAIKMNSFTYSVVSGKQQLVLRGTAGSRQALLDFIKKIKAEPTVVSADLPVSDFAKAENIEFSVTVLINPQKT